MNEKIKELMLQVGFAGYGEESGFYNIPVPAFDSRMERFAELIVRECAEFANWYQANSRYTDIAKAIKEHFGVEE